MIVIRIFLVILLLDINGQVIHAQIHKTSKAASQKNTINNRAIGKPNLMDESSVVNYMTGKTWSCSACGQYTLNFTLDYASRLNTNALFFWTMDRSHPWTFINVTIQTGQYRATISAMNVDDGRNITIHLFNDGHCESSDGNYYSQN